MSPTLKLPAFIRAGLWLLVFSFVLGPSLGWANKPANTFKGKVVLSPMPFPTSFKSDAAFIAHMKKVQKTHFEYGESGKIDLELMAFFAQEQVGSEFTCRILDVTEEPTTVLDFPIYPADKKNRILASGTTLYRDKLPPERNYHLVVSKTYNGPVLAEVRFSITKSAAEKAADKAKAKAELEEARRLMAE